MITLERLKSSFPDGGNRKTLSRKLISLRKIRSAVEERWILMILILLAVVPLSVIKTLGEDGAEVFSSQKGALVLEVFSRTDLAQESYPLLEESLRALDNVKEVIAVSPEESLKNLAGDPKLGLDPIWLKKKSQDLKARDTILPWSYLLHLAKWDEDTLNALVGKIESLEVGSTKVKAVSQIHYDKERWSLTFALYNYIRWLKRLLFALLLAAFAAFLIVIVRMMTQLRFDAELLITAQGFLALGFLSGILSHVAYLVIVSMSFFPETFSWRSQIGHSFIFQMAMSLILSGVYFGAWALEKKA